MMPSFVFSGLDHGGCGHYSLDTDGPVNITAARHASSYASPKCPFPRGCGPYLTVVPSHMPTPATMTSRSVLPFLHSLHRIFYTLQQLASKFLVKRLNMCVEFMSMGIGLGLELGVGLYMTDMI